jgi:hypothetical protein
MIFLYRFDIVDGGINFVLNEGIALDMSAKYEEILRPIVFSLSTLLDKYKHLSTNQTIFKATVLDNGELDLLLSEGLGKHIDSFTKNEGIFKGGIAIANICGNIMDEYCAQINKSPLN